jgi:hypothetical protein
VAKTYVATKAQLDAEAAARAAAITAAVSGLATSSALTSETTARTQAVADETAARAAADAGKANASHTHSQSEVTGLVASLQALSDAVTAEAGTRSTADSALGARVTTLEDAPGGGSGFTFNVVSRTSAVALAVGDFAEADASAGTFTIPLPASPAVGVFVAVKKVDVSANGVGVSAAAGGSIDGDSGTPNININTINAGVVLLHRGSNDWDVFAVMLASGSQGPEGPVGPPGSALLSGSGVPSSGLGADGDFYLRTDGQVYKRVTGAWVDQGFSLVGPQGNPGAAGTNGILTSFKDEGVAVTARDTLDVQGNGAALSQDGTKLILSVPGGDPRGLAGAAAPTRYVGGTADLAPTSGTFAVGDFVVSATAKLWVCTTAGSPGTWTQSAGGSGGGVGEGGADWVPSDFGVKAWTWNPVKESPLNHSFDLGYLRVVRMPIRAAFVVGSITYHKKSDAGAAGAHDYSGVGIARLVGSTFTVLGKTGDLGGDWSAGGDTPEAAPYNGSASGMHPKGVTVVGGQSLALAVTDVIYGVFLVNMATSWQTTRVTPFGLANWGPHPLSLESTASGYAAIPNTFTLSDLDAGRQDIPFLALGT